MKKKKPESPYTMRTIQRAKVQGIKIYLKRYETKPIFMMQPQEHRVLFWLVTSSARFNRKFSNDEAARTCFAQLIEFEKHQTVLYKI